ncbi:hypothetical protein F441_07569 [Phytophthora nicotianae CJ01A1]|uniref:Uncharacterized protein n=6 Tax=Phytophthora nicotianae TaxID=4792 RepID=W2QBA7_PHYN3|nr:hypothetical protein PPTG_10600 [Phytophthora nicotianae INRA-310]ETI48368.1 hypothetical protein F443_07593 [Phytophthora nicotianae P1569]ETK88313.1 hypothetical protein L915_07418 [Phytophthora nicotianae]ETO77159.1 hypothetical protein F444_07605 [Phytophthora nicotianae P1976]ETP18173.1 hypothetical protein F441_07569 [Phytophthora nicotianae CJ01A1]ETP46107.1 hypothetical protein F442_07597 [Phytophthora nicotianae P10297]
MLKHTYDAATSVQDQNAPPAKIAKSISVCEYCDKEFTTRGIPLHQKKCTKKQAHDKAAAKKTRSYKFSVINEDVHEEILSFLSNQTLTKMQMIIGDRYEQCEPELARYCCKCENDNPAIFSGMCRQCESDCHRYRFELADKRMALEKYGITKKDLYSIPQICGKRYDPIRLENYMIEKCGSKMEWVRYLAKRDVRRKKARATRKRNKEEGDVFPNSRYRVRRIGV